MIFFDIDETLFDNKCAQNFAALKLYKECQDLHVTYEESAFPQKWNEVTEKYREWPGVGPRQVIDIAEKMS